MATVFQKTINPADLKHITKLLHPELTKEQIDNSFKYHIKYTWVCVGFRVKRYGYVSFAICNHSQRSYRLIGMGITKNDMTKALEDGEIHFKCWRFNDDRLNDPESTANEVIRKMPKEKCLTDAEDYIKSKYQLPTVREFYNNYYED